MHFPGEEMYFRSLAHRPCRLTRLRSFAFALIVFFALAAAFARAEPVGQSALQTLLVDVDHRQSISLDGDWHFIVDPYGSGLYSFHNELRKDGYFLNKHDINAEYDFSRSPTIKVPGDWNTQRTDLFYYEGPLWYERDLSYHKVAGKRVFLHVGA